MSKILVNEKNIVFSFIIFNFFNFETAPFLCFQFTQILDTFGHTFQTLSNFIF